MSAFEKPMAEALKQLKNELTRNVELDISSTYSAYLLSGEDMETFTRDVHEYFFKKYYPKKKDRINYVISKLADGVDEILLPSLAGKLANKLPPVLIKEHRGDYREAKARLIDRKSVV